MAKKSISKVDAVQQMKELYHEIEGHIDSFNNSSIDSKETDPIISISVDYDDLTLDFDIKILDDKYYLRIKYDNYTYEWDDYYSDEMEGYCERLLKDTSLDFVAFGDADDVLEGFEDDGRDDVYEYGFEYTEFCDAASIKDKVFAILDAFEKL